MIFGTISEHGEIEVNHCPTPQRAEDPHWGSLVQPLLYGMILLWK